MSGLTDYKFVIEKTKELLNTNPEWRERYAGYAESISENKPFIRANRRRFRVFSPLTLYLTTTNAKNAKKKVIFELRYLGQTVAKMKCKKDSMTLSTKGEKYDSRNERDFGCTVRFEDCAWDSAEASAFRSHFKNRPAKRNKGGNIGNEEHRIESLLLSEFSKRKDKALRYIQPVKIAGVRFPMPTPISASDHDKIEYSKDNGGCIDILARTGRGRATKLCVIELKDENDEKEPASSAIKQAIAYTVFIRELLRSDAGAKWWKLFGFNSPLPKHLDLFAACAMPYKSNADTSFSGMEYDLDGDKIKLHHIYFEEDNNTIKKIHTSLPNNPQK